MSEPCNVYSIFVFFVIWFQCTLSLGSTFDAWGSWICVAKCCCVPYNVLCCLVLAVFPVFCFSLNIALVDVWGNAPFGNVLLRTVFPLFMLGSVLLVFSLYSTLCFTVLVDAWGSAPVGYELLSTVLSVKLHVLCYLVKLCDLCCLDKFCVNSVSSVFSLYITKSTVLVDAWGSAPVGYELLPSISMSRS